MPSGAASACHTAGAEMWRSVLFTSRRCRGTVGVEGLPRSSPALGNAGVAAAAAAPLSSFQTTTTSDRPARPRAVQRGDDGAGRAVASRP